MDYQFIFEWGENWTVTEDNFLWDSVYWFKVLARHIVYYRKNVECTDLITTAYIYIGKDYHGIVSVSDNYVHVIVSDPDTEICWMVNEL